MKTKIKKFRKKIKSKKRILKGGFNKKLNKELVDKFDRGEKFVYHCMDCCPTSFALLNLPVELIAEASSECYEKGMSKNKILDIFRRYLPEYNFNIKMIEVTNPSNLFNAISIIWGDRGMNSIKNGYGTLGGFNYVYKDGINRGHCVVFAKDIHGTPIIFDIQVSSKGDGPGLYIGFYEIIKFFKEKKVFSVWCLESNPKGYQNHFVNNSNGLFCQGDVCVGGGAAGGGGGASVNTSINKSKMSFQNRHRLRRQKKREEFAKKMLAKGTN